MLWKLEFILMFKKDFLKFIYDDLSFAELSLAC